MPYEFKLVSSLEKNFFEKPDHLTERSSGSMLKNEIHSFVVEILIHLKTFIGISRHSGYRIKDAARS